MRLKKLTEYHIAQRQIIRDEREGGKHEGFSAPVPILAHIYDKSSQITAATGGISRERVKVMLIDIPHRAVYDPDTRQESYELDGTPCRLQAGDGVCVYTTPEQGPDYRIREITDPGHLECRLERIG